MSYFCDLLKSIKNDDEITFNEICGKNDVSRYDFHRRSFLHHLCSNTYIDCNYDKYVKLLVKNGVNINAFDDEKNTALHISTLKNNIKYVNALLKNGANPLIKNYFNRTPIYIACVNDNYECLNLFFLNKLYKYDDIIGEIEIICVYGYINCLNIIVKYIKINNIDVLFLHHICLNDHSDCFDLFIRCGLNLNIKNKKGYTILSIIAQSGNIKYLNKLINHGTDINYKNNNGSTALMFACSKNNPKIVSLLINKDTDLNVLNHSLMWQFKYKNLYNEYSPFLNNSIKITKKLIQNGCNINVKNQYGEPYIMCKIISDSKWFNFEYIKNLIKLGINIKAQNNNNMQTTLYLCFANNIIDKSIMLFKLGINIKYELYNANKIINCKNNYTKKKYIEELTKYHNIELKLKYEFMYIICSNSIKHELTRFFKLNKGLRGNIGRRIIGYVNAF